MGGITFGHLTDVHLVGFYQAQATRERKPFIAYVLQVDTTTSQFLVYRRYSQIAALAAKLHCDLAVGLPPKYAMQLYPLSKVQLQQRFDGLKAFLHATVAHLATQHATGLHHATSSSAGLDMQLFCDFVAHHRNRPPKPVEGDVPDWAKPRVEGTERDSVTESEDGGLLESDGSDVESDAGSSCFRTQVVQAEGNVGALWHCVRTHQVATVAWWDATCAVFDEYKRVAAMPLLATDDAKEKCGPIPATRLKHEVASTLDVLQSEYAKTCEAQVLRPLQVLRHEVLPEIKHTFWTRHDSVHADPVATTRRVQQERETLQKTLQREVQKSLLAFVALETDMLRTLHQKLQPFTLQQLPRQRSHSTPQLSGMSGQSANGDNHSQPTDVAQEDKQADKKENENEIKSSHAHDEEVGSHLWVWGRPPSLESGTPLSLRPKQVTCLKNQPLVQVACGGEHLLYLTATGDVYTYGNAADKKSLGPPTLPDPDLPTSSSFLTPQLVEEFALAKALNRGMIVQVACGAHHSVALTNTGEVYTWGSGEDGRLGHGDMRDRSVPRKVMTLLRQSVASATCGGAHTAVLTDKGSVFTFGRGRNGRLGLGDTKWRDVPHAVTAFPVHVQKVVQVACGWNFTAAIGQNGQLFTWGKTGEGQCGLGYVESDQVVPQGVQVDHRDLVLVDVACGYTHTVGLTATGVLYSWGLGEYGQLGTGNVYQPVPAPVPMPLETLKPSDAVTRVYCGAFHSIAMTASHVLFGWGLNLYGACGLGHTANQDTPERIDGFSPTHDLVIACGHKYTLALEVDLAWAYHQRGMGRAQVDKLLHLARVPRHETEEELRRVKKMWRTRILRDWAENKDTALTHSLWRQGIPPSLRARVWPLAIGNQLKVTPEMFQIYRRRAAAYKKDRPANDEDTGTLDGGREHTLALIDTDLPRTFPSLKLFDASGPYYAFLLEVLETYACFRPDLGYIQGMSYLAAMLCLHMPHDRYLVFQCLANLMVHEHLFTFYLLDAELASVYYTLFDAFLGARCPRLVVHLRHIGIFSCSMYLMNWLQTMFLQVLPLESAARVFDNFLLDGIGFLFRIAMAIHELLVPYLMEAEMEVVLPMLQHNVMYQEVWYTRVSEQALFDKVATIAVPSHICAALDRVINDVFFYEKRGHGEPGGSSKMMAFASGGQSAGIGHGKHDRRSMYAISDALNGVLGGF